MHFNSVWLLDNTVYLEAIKLFIRQGIQVFFWMYSEDRSIKFYCLLTFWLCKFLFFKPEANLQFVYNKLLQIYIYILNGPKSAYTLFCPSLFLFRVKQRMLSLPGLHSTLVLSFSQQISSYSSLVLCTPVTASPFAVQQLQPRIQIKMKSLYCILHKYIVKW